MGRSSRGSRSQPLRSPRASRHAPAAAIIAALSVLSRGEATLTRAVPASRSRQPLSQGAVAGDAAADHGGRIAERLDRVGRLRDEDVDRRVLESAGEVGAIRRQDRCSRARPGAPPS